jgi:hypothetical protein
MWSEVSSFSNRPKGSFLSDRKQRFRAVSTGSGTILRRSKMVDEKWIELRQNAGKYRRLRGCFEGSGGGNWPSWDDFKK